MTTREFVNALMEVVYDWAPAGVSFTQEEVASAFPGCLPVLERRGVSLDSVLHYLVQGCLVTRKHGQYTKVTDLGTTALRAGGG